MIHGRDCIANATARCANAVNWQIDLLRWLLSNELIEIDVYATYMCIVCCCKADHSIHFMCININIECIQMKFELLGRLSMQFDSFWLCAVVCRLTAQYVCCTLFPFFYLFLSYAIFRVRLICVRTTYFSSKSLLFKIHFNHVPSLQIENLTDWIRLHASRKCLVFASGCFECAHTLKHTHTILPSYIEIMFFNLACNKNCHVYIYGFPDDWQIYCSLIR